MHILSHGKMSREDAEIALDAMEAFVSNPLTRDVRMTKHLELALRWGMYYRLGFLALFAEKSMGQDWPDPLCVSSGDQNGQCSCDQPTVPNTPCERRLK